MKSDPPSFPSRRVAIYERPASADRPPRRWIVLAVTIAVAVASAWGFYFFWVR
jgi:hypothetical protein